MYIKDIELINFRNYDYLKKEFGRNVNLIIGSNAQGKTNPLEGIYLTSIGRSFRTSQTVKWSNLGNQAKVKNM